MTGSVFQESVQGKSKDRSGERTEYVTIFHNHDSRMGLDPHKMCAETPGAYDITSTPMEYVNQDGTTKIKALDFGKNSTVPLGDRNKAKPAGPEYNVKWDSLVINPRPKYGFFPQDKRIYIPLKENEIKKGGPDLSVTNNSSELNSPSKRTATALQTISKYGTEAELNAIAHTNSFKAALVPLPKLKKRTPQKLHFDRSAYGKVGVIDDLTPSYIKNAAKIDFFSGIVKIPRKHVSTSFMDSTKLASKVIQGD